MKAVVAALALVLAACSPEAMEPGAPLSQDVAFKPYPGVQWYAPDGDPVPEKSEKINAITGPEHCAWESGVILHLRWPLGSDSGELRQYFRDPEGVFPQTELEATFDQDAQLPQSATNSGYRTDFMKLWFDPKDDAAAYLVFADHTERWPRGELACG
jgi:hypothetical protein